MLGLENKNKHGVDGSEVVSPNLAQGLELYYLSLDDVNSEKPVVVNLFRSDDNSQKTIDEDLFAYREREFENGEKIALLGGVVNTNRKKYVNSGIYRLLPDGKYVNTSSFEEYEKDGEKTLLYETHTLQEILDANAKDNLWNENQNTGRIDETLIDIMRKGIFASALTQDDYNRIMAAKSVAPDSYNDIFNKFKNAADWSKEKIVIPMQDLARLGRDEFSVDPNATTEALDIITAEMNRDSSDPSIDEQ